jgi:arylsulfatase A-like enzyme
LEDLAMRFSAQRLVLAPAIACLALASVERCAAEETRPNIVFMMVDNFGYGDLGSYGGGAVRGMPTPRIDKLAAEGLRLTNFNVEPECTPTRSALMTGRMPIRSGTSKVPLPGLPQGITPWEYTIAELFHDAGYQSAMYGKWHLGDKEGRYPTNQGFDEWWGFPHSSAETLNNIQPGYSAELAPRTGFKGS